MFPIAGTGKREGRGDRTVLQSDPAELLRILKDFHRITGARIGLFDEAERELLAWPRELLPACRRLREDPLQDARCRACDREAFDAVRRTGRPSLYRCHAGLTEALAPLLEDGVLFGFMMIGNLRENDHDRAAAIASLMTICAAYLRLTRRVARSDRPAADRLREILDSRYREPLTLEALSAELHLSRTGLCRVAREELGAPVGTLLLRRRMEEARRLLSESDEPVGEVALRCGFADPAHFSRLFRREGGTCPRTWRRLVRKKQQTR